ncbi:MAG: glycosyl hydrolase family 95 catalytic domain-containing protein [Microbacter sp.]
MKISLLYFVVFFISPLIFSQSIDPWKIQADHIDANHYYGVTVANGMIGIVSSPNPFEVKDVVLAGTYDLYGRGMVSNFLHSFNLLNAYLEIDGNRIAPNNVSNFRQVLDMHHANFTTSFDYGDKASVSYTYYALRQLPFTVLMNVSILAKKDIQITAASVMEAPDALKDVQNYYNEIETNKEVFPLLISSAKSPTGRLLMCASNTFLFNEIPGHEPTIVHEMWDSNMHFMKFSKKLKAGETYRFAIAGSSITSAQTNDPMNEVQRTTIYAKLEGIDRLIAKHDHTWDDLWQSDIKIDGDEQAQQDVHSMLYHLYSFVRSGSALSLSPMGLSGLGYNGHVFWDADIWMFPVLLVLHPELAQSMIEYRFNRLEAARKNAFLHGYKGAMFPWESADSGDEETPVWALSGPFEQHISGDVGFAAWNYFCVTQDTSWLKEKGWPILKETADFWQSRVERNSAGHYDINNVVAADEWAENVDNDAFTNAVAKKVLQCATKAAKILNIQPDPYWMVVANNIPILKMADGITKEFATYHGENIKQADVNLLAYPLYEITDQQQIEKDLIYYSQRVPDQGTPAMTQAIFALLYARLGNSSEAYRWFKESYEPNLDPPFRVIAETKGGTNPYFATGAGGVLQSVLMGFGGLEITSKGIVQVKSVLPPFWKKLTITGVGINKNTYSVSR